MGLNKHVKSVIEITTCPVHLQQPVLTIVDKRIVMDCCCIDFEITCFKELVKMLLEDKKYSEECGCHQYDPATVATPIVR